MLNFRVFFAFDVVGKFALGCDNRASKIKSVTDLALTDHLPLPLYISFRNKMRFAWTLAFFSFIVICLAFLVFYTEARDVDSDGVEDDVDTDDDNDGIPDIDDPDDDNDGIPDIGENDEVIILCVHFSLFR